MKLTQGLEGANMRGPRNLLEGIFALLSKDAGQKHAAAAVKSDNIRAAAQRSSAPIPKSDSPPPFFPPPPRRCFRTSLFRPLFLHSVMREKARRPSVRPKKRSLCSGSLACNNRERKNSREQYTEPTCSCSLNPRTGQEDAPKTSPRHGGAAVHILCSW